MFRSAAMGCDQEEEIYPTDHDGENGLQCFRRQCKNKTAILRCFGNWSHDYPLSDHIDIHARLAFRFMKNHPRRR